MLPLEDKVAIITSISRGLGVAIFETTTHVGTSVVITSRAEISVNTAVSGIRDIGFEAVGYVCDEGNPSQYF